MSEASEAAGKIFDLQVLRKLMAFVKPYKGRFYFVVFLTLVTGLLAPFRVWLVNHTVDEYIAKPSTGNSLLFMALLMVGLLILQSVGQYLHTYMSGWLGQSIIRDIRTKLYRHILGLRLKFFDNTQVGRLITRNISDVETLSDVFTEGLAAMASDLLQLTFILTFMLYTNWKLTLVSLCTFPLLFVSTWIFKEGIKRTFNQVRAAVANLSSFVQEHITGMSIVQLFNAEEQEYNKFKQINATHRDANIKSVLYYSIYFPVAEVIGAAGTGLLVWYGGREVLNEHVTLGMLIAFIMYIQMFFRPIRAIADRFNTLQLGVVSASRIFNLIDNHDVIENKGSIEVAKYKGKIAFNDVHFSYNEDREILHGISFVAQPGETIALVGATGAGKSSIINLLNRFYDINSGSIEIDDTNIKSFTLNTLRNNIGLVLQDVFLFSSTIRENITLGNPDITDAQILHAAELVGASAFINQLPGGLDYKVMERGATLSMGQRQLISFIRAMVYNPSIIVLDEATSSVDTETEEMIQQAILSMMKGRTSIVVAHRLSTIKNAHQILVMEQGNIIERGTHDELLNLNGAYANLHQMQFKFA